MSYLERVLVVSLHLARVLVGVLPGQVADAEVGADQPDPPVLLDEEVAGSQHPVALFPDENHGAEVLHLQKKNGCVNRDRSKSRSEMKRWILGMLVQKLAKDQIDIFSRIYKKSTENLLAIELRMS